MLERGLDRGRLPALSSLVEAGRLARGTSVFPSLTPVCLASIATGAYPDVHHIPHLVWYHRGEGRLVEYGSSFSAMRAVGARRSIRDTIFAMNHEHLRPRRHDRVRGARGRGPRGGGDQLHVLPRAHAPPDPPARARAPKPLVRGRLRAERLLLLQPVRVGRDRCAARDPLSARGLDRRVCGDGRALARHARRLRLPRLLPPGLRLRVAPGRAGGEPGGARALGRARSRSSSRPREGSTSFSSATRSSSARITARRAVERLARSRSIIRRVGAGRDRRRRPPTAPGSSIAWLAAAWTRARSPSASTATRPPTSSSSARSGGRRAAGRRGASLRARERRLVGWRATPPCSTPSGIRTGSSAPGGRSPARTRATCSCPRRRAGSSPTSEDATT